MRKGKSEKREVEEKKEGQLRKEGVVGRRVLEVGNVREEEGR